MAALDSGSCRVRGLFSRDVVKEPHGQSQAPTRQDDVESVCRERLPLPRGRFSPLAKGRLLDLTCGCPLRDSMPDIRAENHERRFRVEYGHAAAVQHHC